jgi:RNA polymerase sigma-70 factor (family 1)
MHEVIEPEKELLLEIAEGNEHAFGRLFYSYLPILHPFIMKFTKSTFDTEEIVQNTFLKVWLNREKLETVVSIRSWLYKYAANECLNHLRSKKYKSKLQDELLNVAIRNDKHSMNTVEVINVNEVKNLVFEAVSRLPKQRKEIYTLSRNHGKTIPEIALQLQISPNTVKNALVISLKFIRNYLTLHGYQLSLLYLYFLNNYFNS